MDLSLPLTQIESPRPCKKMQWPNLDQPLRWEEYGQGYDMMKIISMNCTNHRLQFRQSLAEPTHWVKYLRPVSKSCRSCSLRKLALRMRRSHHPLKSLKFIIHISHPLKLTISRVFFGRFEKNSSSKKLKTQAKSIKTQVKIPKKLKNRQLHLSLVGGKFSSTTIFGLNCTIQYLISDQPI